MGRSKMFENKKSGVKLTSHWVDGDMPVLPPYCFNCGVYADLRIVCHNIGYHKSKFCPHCGLRMTNKEDSLWIN